MRSVVQIHSGPLAVRVSEDDPDCYWGFSSVGRASALQVEGQRFESVKLHDASVVMDKHHMLFDKLKQEA